MNLLSPETSRVQKKSPVVSLVHLPAKLCFRPQPNCTNRLLWEAQLSPTLILKWCTALLAIGFVDESPIDALKILRTPEGHALVIVPRTGRIQLRISYLTPPDLRPKTAQDLGGYLEQFIFYPLPEKPLRP